MTEIKPYKDEAEAYGDMIDGLNSVIARQDAEIARLRAGLQVIADNPDWTDHGARARGILEQKEKL